MSAGVLAARIRKILDAIAECNRYISMESDRSADLRPAAAQQHLDFCIAHRQKLTNMFSEAS